VSASVRKKWGYERKLLDSRFGRRGRSSSCFLLLLLFIKHFYFFKTFQKSNNIFIQQCLEK
jgi:hypothetical protein